MNEKTKKKPVLVYDGTVLTDAYSRSASGQLGAFFTAYYIFLQLMQQDMYQVIVYADDRCKDDVVRAVADFGYPDVKVVGSEGLVGCGPDIYLTPFAPPADIAADSHAAKYMILYDVAPHVLPDIEVSRQEWYEKLERSLNGEDRYFAVSERSRWDFLRYYPVLEPSHVKVAYPAASERFYHCNDKKTIADVKDKYGIPTDVPYIFSLCAPAPRKNLAHAVKCFARFVMENDIDDLVFVLGGSHQGEFLETLDQEIDFSDSVRNRIIQTGCIDDEDLAPLYSGAMFSVYVSLYEGFGLPVVEAMQCGCPVITSSVSALPEVIGDAGLTVDPQDPVALRKAYKMMYTDAGFREECSRKGLERAGLFSWKKCADMILSVITESWEQAVADNKKKLACRPKPEQKRLDSPLFGKVWTPERTTVYFLGMPVARKDKTPEKQVTRLFGVPLKKRVFDRYVATTYLGPFPIRKRPNYTYIENQVDLYTGVLANRLQQLQNMVDENRTRSHQGRDARTLVSEKLKELPSYQLVTAVGKGTVTLERELRRITEMMEQKEEEEV